MASTGIRRLPKTSLAVFILLIVLAVISGTQAARGLGYPMFRLGVTPTPPESELGDVPTESEPVNGELVVESSEQPADLTEESSEQPVDLAEESSEQPVDLAEESSEQPVGLTEESSEQPVGLTEESSEQPVGLTEESSEQPVGLTEESSEQPVGLAEESSEQLVDIAEHSSEHPVVSSETTDFADIPEQLSPDSVSGDSVITPTEPQQASEAASISESVSSGETTEERISQRRNPTEKTINGESSGETQASASEELAIKSPSSPSTPQLKSSEGCAPFPPIPFPCSTYDGPYQSPIDIDPCGDHFVADRTPLRFKNLESIPESLTLYNSGDTVYGLVSWGNEPPATISGGRLPGTFVYALMDLHWGANSSYGSEHTVNGHRYSGEMHLGFKNIKYSSIEEALEKTDGLVSIAVFLDLNVPSLGKRGLAPLAEAIHQITEPFDSAHVASPPSLHQLLPRRLDRYVGYTGSPTTGSPCWGSVSWIVLLEPLRVLEAELQLLRDLRDFNGYRLCQSSIRDLQEVSGREIYTRGRFLRCPRSDVSAEM